MKDEVKRLYRLGFAILWLHPKSKKPIGGGWTTGPRKTWKELLGSYHLNNNIGVRLGEPSQVDGLFLAAIDFDVKSGDPGDLSEATAKLWEILPGELVFTGSVFSGRGLGSKHLYCLTREPAQTRRLCQSSKSVKVHIPSVDRFTPHERGILTPDEMKRGIHIRPAWEICIMGTGSQTVLPPSIHPDSGKPYLWDTRIDRVSDLVILEGPVVGDAKKTAASKPGQRYCFQEIDIALHPKMSRKVISILVEGKGVSDRSGALLSVAGALAKAGLSDIEILSILTDQAYFLGSVAYEHAKTDNRDRAAAWLERYTLPRAKAGFAAEAEFDSVVGDSPKLTEKEAQSQVVELVDELDWKDLIERTKTQEGARPRNTLKNVILILQGEGGQDVFRRDEFAHADLYGCDTPWKGKRGMEYVDHDTVRIKKWLADHYGFEPSDDRIVQAMTHIADQNRFHPVRDYLDGLEWDGIPRIDHWLKTYMNASGKEPYLSAVSRKVLVTMVKRIYEPGCKADHVLILEGTQGAGKSAAVRALASDQWFTDAHINIQDKDAIMTMRSVWIIELGELSTMRKAETDQLKEFVTRQTDRIRVPYGRRAENFPRQCIFIGTTNRREYLKDTTGNRRFWPVWVGKCDFEGIRRDRDQLLAEAKFCHELSEPLYLETEEMRAGAVEAQSERMESDAWEEILAGWLDGEPSEAESAHIDRKRFSMVDLFSDFGPLSGNRMHRSETLRAGELLRKLGYEKKTSRGRNGKLAKLWLKNED